MKPAALEGMTLRKALLASVTMGCGLCFVSAVYAEALVNIQQPGIIAGAISPPGFSTANPSTAPQLPSTITVRIDGRLWFYAYGGSDSGRNATVTPVAGSVTSLGSPQTNTKLAAYGFGNYVRLYPQFAGLTANGIRYGAFSEIRQDNASPPGGGINGSISASNRTRGQLYFRREYVYAGTDTLGTLRLGNADQPTVAFYTGSMGNFNDGGWDGDLPSFFTGGTSLAGLPFLDVGNLYATSKAVYLSPRFAGFDFGVSFEPSTAGENSGPGNCPFGVTANAGLVTSGVGGNSALGCDAASSTSSGDNVRRRNTIDAAIRYRAAFGPVGVAVTAGGMYGGRVLDNSTPAKPVQFSNLAVFDTGAEVTYGGLTVGGHLDIGRFNGQWSLAPRGTPDAIFMILGASYAAGPVIVGANFVDYWSAGSRTAVSPAGIGNRHEFGVAVGGTYQLTQGVNIYLSGLYGERHEAGVDLLSGATGTALTPVKTNNNTRALGGSIGTVFKW